MISIIKTIPGCCSGMPKTVSANWHTDLNVPGGPEATSHSMTKVAIPVYCAPLAKSSYKINWRNNDHIAYQFWRYYHRAGYGQHTCDRRKFPELCKKRAL